MAEKENGKHQSLSSIRLLTIMEVMSRMSGPMRLTELTSAMDVTAPTLLRYLNALISAGYAYQDPTTGMYNLTWKVCGLADNIHKNTTLRSLISPHLQELSRSLGLGVLLSTERNNEVIYLDMVVSPMSMETFLRIGKDAPIHSTGSGKILLSERTDAQITAVLTEKGMPKLTEHTITEIPTYLEEIHKVRENGYALDDEECEIGHRCVTVPLRDYTGKIIAAISAFDSAESLTDEKIQATMPKLMEASARISHYLGYEG